MCDLGRPLKKAHPSIYEEFCPYLYELLQAVDALEPYQLQRAGCVFQFGHQPAGAFVTQYIHTHDTARHLDEFRVRTDVPYEVDTGPVHMTIWEEVQQIIEREDLQLLFQKVSPVRPNPFQIFDRIAEYGNDRADEIILR